MGFTETFRCASVDKGDGAFLGIHNGDGTQHGICKSSYTADMDPKFRPEFKIGEAVRNDLEPTFRNNWGHDEGPHRASAAWLSACEAN